jgi:hypothetical protein
MPNHPARQLWVFCAAKISVVPGQNPQKQSEIPSLAQLRVSLPVFVTLQHCKWRR